MEKDSAKNNKKAVYIAIITTITILFIATITFIVMLFMVKFNNNVSDNTYLGDKDISKMKPEELAIYVSSLGSDLKKMSIDVLDDGKKIYTITPEMLDIEIDINSTVKNILNDGKSDNIFENLFNTLKNDKKNFDPIISYDKEKLEMVIKNINLTLDERVIYDTYYIADDNKSLILVKGKDGYVVDEDDLEEKLIDIIKNQNEESLSLKLNSKLSYSLDKDEIIKEVKKDVKDAYIDESTYPVTFVSESYGIDIDDDLLAENIVKLDNLNEGESIEIALNVVTPKVFLSDIRYDMYNDKLSSYTTYFAGNQINRSKNIEIASKLINEQIIMPGEVFSFNNTVGEVTIDKGYVNAATFQGGKIVDGLGGGICQVSSTLYNTVLLANLEIVERYCHSLPVSYVLPSRDATIYVGALDFKFRNTRSYPIKIVTSYSQVGTLAISIYGTKEEVEYDIEIESKVLREIEFDTEYIYDSSVSGQEIVSDGTNGRVSEAYIVKKLHGKEIERALLSRDTYSPSNRVVKVDHK